MLKLRNTLPAIAALALTSVAYLLVCIPNTTVDLRHPASETNTNDPAFLADYNYQLTELDSFAQAQNLFNRLDREFRATSICANRAHVWSYNMLRESGIKSGKVFIHFTPSGEADENTQWAFHVAPYVIVKEKSMENGVEVITKKEYVLDAGFSFRGPVTIAEWSNYFGKSPNCVVLDPINNKNHLALEENNAPGLGANPNLRSMPGSHQYPTPPDSTCYIRKTSMYYWMPYVVYGNDLYQSGRAEYSQYHVNEFIPSQLMQACRNGIQGGFLAKKKFCKEYFGWSDDS